MSKRKRKAFTDALQGIVVRYRVSWQTKRRVPTMKVERYYEDYETENDAMDRFIQLNTWLLTGNVGKVTPPRRVKVKEHK